MKPSLHATRLLALALVSVALPLSPVVAGVQVEGGLTRVLSLQPGQKVSGVIPVRNTSDQAVEITAYQTELRVTPDDTRYDEPGTAGYPRSNASWITFSPRQMTLAPRQRLSIEFVVQVPDDSALSGSYFSALMVQPQCALTTTAQDEAGKVKVGINNVFRFCIQMIVNVGDGARCEVSFADKRIVQLEGKRMLQVDLANPGERVLSPAMWGEFYDGDGALALRAEAPRHRIYPGCWNRFLLDISSLAPGSYEALIIADNGDEHVFGARYCVQIH